MEFVDIIKKRRSIRKFDNKKFKKNLYNTGFAPSGKIIKRGDLL